MIAAERRTPCAERTAAAECRVAAAKRCVATAKRRVAAATAPGTGYCARRQRRTANQQRCRNRGCRFTHIDSLRFEPNRVTLTRG